MRWWDDCYDETEVFDPLRVERSRPVEDDEAALFETLCQAASPGPLVVDDHAAGEGVVVATLPDGRHIVSLRTAECFAADSPRTIAANAQLICEARFLALRLLRDREKWQRREKCLLEKIQSLKLELDEQREAVEEPEWTAASQHVTRPR